MSTFSTQIVDILPADMVRRGDLPTVTYRGPVYPEDATATLNFQTSLLLDGATLDIKDSIFVAGTWVISKNINIRVHGCVLVFTSAETSCIHWTPTEFVQPDIPGSALSATPKRGDESLTFGASPLSVPSDHFLHLISSEDLITRLGSETYTPYKKMEVVSVGRDDWTLATPININYITAGDLTIKPYRKGRPVAIEGMKVLVEPLPGATTKPHVLLIEGRSNMTFRELIVDRTASNLTGSSVLYKASHGLTFEDSWIVGGNSDSGDSYAFQHSSTDSIVFVRSGYRDAGVTTKRERGIAGRHGSNYTIRDCKFPGVDDHWGYRYLIDAVEMSVRGISFAGGDLTVRDSTNKGGALVSLRSDTPYADGKLLIENSNGAGSLLYSVRATDPLSRNTRRKAFDEIVIRDSGASAVNGAALVDVLNWGTAGDASTKTRSVLLDNVRLLNRGLGTTYYMRGPAATTRWAESIQILGGDAGGAPTALNPSKATFSNVDADRITVSGLRWADGTFGTDVTTSELTSVVSHINMKSGKARGMRAMNVTTGIQVFASGPWPEDPWLFADGTVAHTPTFPLVLTSTFNEPWAYGVGSPNSISALSPGIRISVTSNSPPTTISRTASMTVGRYYRLELDTAGFTGPGFQCISLAATQGGLAAPNQIVANGTVVLRGYAIRTDINISRNAAPTGIDLLEARLYGGI